MSVSGIGGGFFLPTSSVRGTSGPAIGADARLRDEPVLVDMQV
jgi:hypothetical protein